MPPDNTELLRQFFDGELPRDVLKVAPNNPCTFVNKFIQIEPNSVSTPRKFKVKMQAPYANDYHYLAISTPNEGSFPMNYSWWMVNGTAALGDEQSWTVRLSLSTGEEEVFSHTNQELINNGKQSMSTTPMFCTDKQFVHRWESRGGGVIQTKYFEINPVIFIARANQLELELFQFFPANSSSWEEYQVTWFGSPVLL